MFKKIIFFIILILNIILNTNIYSIEDNLEYNILLKLSEILNKNAIEWLQETWHISPILIWENNNGISEAGIDDYYTIRNEKSNYYLVNVKSKAKFKLKEFDILILNTNKVVSLFNNKVKNDKLSNNTIIICTKNTIYIYLFDKDIVIPIER